MVHNNNFEAKGKTKANNPDKKGTCERVECLSKVSYAGQSQVIETEHNKATKYYPEEQTQSQLENKSWQRKFTKISKMQQETLRY